MFILQVYLFRLRSNNKASEGDSIDGFTRVVVEIDESGKRQFRGLVSTRPMRHDNPAGPTIQTPV